MKIIFLLILALFISCQKLDDGDNIDYYINYTVTSPRSTQRFTYYFQPNFEVGTVEFIIYFSNSKLSCHFYIFNGDTLIDEINDFYQNFIFHTLKVPEGNPPILRMEVTNYNYVDPYYLYIYNKNYKIPLIFPNYYLYQISLKDLEIQYVINNLPEDTNLKMEAKIQYPQLKDQLQIILYDEGNEISYTFTETSSSFFKLEKNKNYSLKLIPTFNSQFTQYTYFFMTFGNEQDFPILFYQNPTLLFTTILSDNKWYIIDSVNSIDKYNSYNFTFMEGYQNVKDIKINIGIKKYETYDVDYIKNNIPISISSYDEIYYLENSNSMNFEACKASYTNDKLILIYIELNYNSEISSLYKYSFKKNIQNQQLKFTTYSINWYTNYEFSPLTVQSKDIIFIQTNHTSTVFPFSGGNYKKFDSFLNGLLHISYLFEDSSKNQVKLKYSDEGVEREYELDVGMLDVFKFDNEHITFDILIINELVQSKMYLFELKKNYDKYYYIKINQKGNYYIFSEEMDEYYSFFTISQMPVSIKEFYQKTSTKNETSLLAYGNEYILKIGYLLPEYTLSNMYILKDDNSRTFYLEEGKVKITTFSSYEERKILELNIIQKNISNETYINLRIPSKEKTGNLYVSLDETQDQTYILNNTGVNIYNLKEEKILTINIENNDHIDGDIPILIKLGLGKDKIKPILNNNKSELNYDQFGIFKFPNNKIIKMKFLLESTGLTFNYYSGYLSSDYINDTSNIISPELVNNEKLNSKEHYFELKTELDISRNVKQNKNSMNKEESLYLIFSFDGKVEILSGNYIDNIPDDDHKGTSSILLILTLCFICLILIGIGIYIYRFVSKRNKTKNTKNKNININENETPQKEKFLDESYNKPTPEEKEGVTIGNEPKYELSVNNYKPENTTKGENNKINDENNTLDPEQPAPLPF